MKIIADCGGTKSEWRVLHLDGSADRYISGGMNASTMSADTITGRDSLRVSERFYT